MLVLRNKVIVGIGYSLNQTSVKRHGSSYMVLFVLKQGPFCPETCHSVLRPGPFCPETWSVLSGLFCPWSVLSEYLHNTFCYPMLHNL